MTARTHGLRRRWIVAASALICAMLGVLLAGPPMPHPAEAVGAPPLPKSPQALTSKAIIATTADQTRPALAFSPAARRYLVVWEDARNGAALTEIWGRLVDLGGNTTGAAFLIAGGDKARHRPRVVHNATAGEFLVVFEYDYSATDRDVHAWRVSDGGSPVGVEATVAYSTTAESRPVVAYNSTDNQYLVVWQYWVGDVEFGNSDIGARRLNAVGDLLGAEIAVKTGAYSQDSPAVAYLASRKQYDVMWVDHAAALYPRIYEQRLDNAGAKVGAEINSTGFGANTKPNMVYDATEDEYAFVFENKTYGPPDRMDNYVYVSNLAYGFGWGGPVNWAHDFEEYEPDIAYGPGTRNYAIVWEAEFSVSDHDVYMLLYEKIKFNTCCRRIGPTVVSNGTWWEGNPAIAANDGAASLAVWEDNRNAGNGMDIYGAVIYHQPLYLPIIRR